MVVDTTNFWSAVDEKFRMPMGIQQGGEAINAFPSDLKIYSKFKDENIENPIIHDVLIYNNGNKSILRTERVIFKSCVNKKAHPYLRVPRTDRSFLSNLRRTRQCQSTRKEPERQPGQEVQYTPC
jgi:hypothetical protein